MFLPTYRLTRAVVKCDETQEACRRIEEAKTLTEKVPCKCKGQNLILYVHCFHWNKPRTFTWVHKRPNWMSRRDQASWAFILSYPILPFSSEIYCPTQFAVRRQGGQSDPPDPPSRTPLMQGHWWKLDHFFARISRSKKNAQWTNRRTDRP